MKRTAAAVLILALVSLVGCGGDSGSGEPASDPLAGYPKGPVREFIVPGGDNVIPEYGREGTPEERAQASRVLERWMRARAARDFAEECRYFSRGYVKALVAEDAERVTNGKVKTCPQALAYFGEDASGDFKDTLDGPIVSLRVPNARYPEYHTADPGPSAHSHGFALYHGNDGVDYQIPMDREGGKWLVGQAKPLSRGSGE